MSEADKRLRTKVGIQHDLGMKGHGWDNYALSIDILHQELGYNGDEEKHSGYQIDDLTRNVLIAHGRQDTAHALCNTTSLLHEIEGMRQKIVLMFWMNVATLGIVVWLLWRH